MSEDTGDSNDRIVVSRAAATSFAAVAKSVQAIITGVQYRAGLRALVETLQADQCLRHHDVDFLLSVLDQYGRDMSVDVRSEYYLSILALLSTTGLRDRIPPPR